MNKEEYTEPEVEIIVFDRWIDTIDDSNWGDLNGPF